MTAFRIIRQAGIFKGSWNDISVVGGGAIWTRLGTS